MTTPASEVGNIIAKHSDESEKERLAFQKFFDEGEQRELKEYLDKKNYVFVKSGFANGHIVEYMWMQAMYIDLNQKTITGRLTNTPVNITGIKLGDWTVVKFENILSLQKGQP